MPGQPGRVFWRLAVLALFSLAGSIVGAEASWYGLRYDPGWIGWTGGYRYYVEEGIALGPDSDAGHLVALVRGQHPGVQVVATGPRSIVISATGSFHEGWLVTKAGREVVARSDGQARRSVGGMTRELAGNPIEYGILAGLGIGLGLLVPPRRRAPA
jgi:hypothetical protein